LYESFSLFVNVLKFAPMGACPYLRSDFCEMSTQYRVDNVHNKEKWFRLVKCAYNTNN